MSFHTTMRDEVILLVRDGDEHFYTGQLSLSFLNNILPQVGDLITFQVEDSGIGVSRVDERILADMTHTDGAAPSDCCWVLVVSDVDDERIFNLDMLLRRVKEEGYGPAFLENPLDELDRENRDPAYWTPERKKLLKMERDARVAAMNSEWGKR